MKFMIVAVVAALTLAACGSSGVTPKGPAPMTYAPMKFSVVIPLNTRTSTGDKRPAYVSPSTQSVSFALTDFNGNPQASTPVVVDLSGGNCSGSPVVCTATSSEPVGVDTFKVSLYDTTDGTGTPLSTNASVVTSVTQAGPNNISVTLNGVVASIMFFPETYDAVNGTASAGAVGLYALDADSNIIIGPGDYVKADGTPDPLTLACGPHLTPQTAGGAAANTTITGPDAGSASPNNLGQIRYDGTAIGGAAGGTLTCSASDTAGHADTFSLVTSASGSVTWVLQ
jgi:hypothetical protein